MADKFLRCEVVGSIANSITVKPYVDGAGIITVCQQDNILFDPDTLRAEGAEEMRQAALNALARTAREKFNLSDEYNHYLAGLMDGELAIKGLPTIQPEVLACGNGELVAKPEPQWIPVSERLPEDYVDVLVWFEYFRYGNYNRMHATHGIGNYSKEYNSWAINHETGWKDLHVFAWMPLPEPYGKEDVQDEQT